MPAQIAVLLALTADLFDDVPLEKMPKAETAVIEAASKIPAEIRARCEAANNLNDEDRQTITELAREALAVFMSDFGSETASDPPNEIESSLSEDPT